MTFVTHRRLAAAAAVAAVVAATLPALPAQAITSGHIRGQITVPRGISTSGLEVGAYRLVDGKWRSTNRMTHVSSSGRFDIGSLRTGTHRIYVSDLDGKVVREWYDNAQTIDKAANIKVRAGRYTTVNRIHLSRAAHIRGRLLTTSGSPTRNAAAHVYARVGTGWRQVGNAYPDRYGVYDVGGLRAGSYRVGFRSDDRRYVDEFYPNAASVETASTITLQAGEVVRGRNAVLVNGARIRGALTTDEGLPLKDGVVTVLRQAGEAWIPVGGASAADDGRYEVRGLAAGTYRLRFWTLWGYHAEEFWDDATAVTRAADIVVPTASIISGKDAELAGVALFAGQVRTASSEFIDGIVVKAHRPVPGEPDRWEVAQTAVTEPPRQSGSPNYQMKLAPGKYRFTFEDPSGRYVDRTLDDALDVEVVRSGNVPYYRTTLVERPAE